MWAGKSRGKDDTELSLGSIVLLIYTVWDYSFGNRKKCVFRHVKYDIILNFLMSKIKHEF